MPQLPGGKARHRGACWERAAERWLRQRGLTPITRNFHTRRGEIDLVMRDGDTLVFVEVRQRSSADQSAAQTVNPRKIRRVRSAAAQFLSEQKLNEPVCRFDVIGINGDGPDANIEWLRDAF